MRGGGGLDLGPLPVGWSAGRSGDAGEARDRRHAGHALPDGPRRPLLLGWQRLPRAWKRSRVSLARRAGFVNKHWGGRRRPRSRWLCSCPPGQSLPLTATPAHARGRRRRPVPGAQWTPSHLLTRRSLSQGPVGCSCCLFHPFVGSFIHSTKIYSIIWKDQCRDQGGPCLHHTEVRRRSKQVLQCSVASAMIECEVREH